MKITLLQIHTLADIPSASGIEQLESQYYLIGDNTQYLFVLSENWELQTKHPLFTPKKLQNGVIPKKHKPDLEAMTLLKWEDENKLLILGSGSRPTLREKAYWIDLQDFSKIEEFDLAPIYANIRASLALQSHEKLNIEAICASEENLFLLQRGNISGKNALLVYDKYEFISFLNGISAILPQATIYYYDLPEIKGIKAGFSGAVFIAHSQQILFTASVEDTDNEIDDGKILGSFVGLIELKSPNQVPKTALLEHEGNTFLGKIESITCMQIIDNHLIAVAVTDSDGGASMLVRLDIQL